MFRNRSEPGAPANTQEWFTPGRFAFLLAFLIFAAYPDVVTGRATFFHRDFAVFGYPLAYYHRLSFWRGEIPLWNPLNYCGVPFLAQWNTMALYPPSLFYLLLPLSWSLGVFCLGHLFLGGMGMYFLAHRWSVNRLGAAVAGLTYSFNSLALNFLMWPNNVAAFGWLPWVVLAAELGWTEGGRWLLLAVLVGALQMLSGAPEIILLSWILLGALMAAKVISEREQAGRVIGRFVVIVIGIAGLSAAQLLPFLELLAHSQRDTGFADSIWSMPSWGWANFLVPLYRAYLTPLGSYAQPDQYWISSYYLGASVLVMACLAIVFVRQARVWLLGGLALFCLVLALGRHATVYGALKQLLPGLGFMRFPIKFVTLPAALAPLLAGIFVGHYMGLSQSDLRRVSKRIGVAALATILIIAALCWSALHYPLEGTSAQVAAASGASRAVFVIAVLGGFVLLRHLTKPLWVGLAQLCLLMLLWLDPLTAGPRTNPTAPRWVYDAGLARKELHMNPVPATGESRAMLGAQAESNFAIAPLSNAVDQVVYARLALFADVNLLDDMPKVVGMYSLFFREIGDVLGNLYGTTNAPSGLMDFLAVSYTNAPGKVTEWGPRPTHLPWITGGQTPVFADAGHTLMGLAAPAFDPRQSVYLPLEHRGIVTATNASVVNISAQQFSPRQVQFVIENSAPALAVIAQAFSRNWRAYVDDAPTAVLRANHAFQAVEVPAGKHRVRLVYEDRAFRLGSFVSVLTAVVWVGLWFWNVRARKLAGPT
jgi:hypothetical protein